MPSNVVRCLVKGILASCFVRRSDVFSFVGILSMCMLCLFIISLQNANRIRMCLVLAVGSPDWSNDIAPVESRYRVVWGLLLNVSSMTSTSHASSSSDSDAAMISASTVLLAVHFCLLLLYDMR